MPIYTAITPVALTITDDATYQDVDVSAHVTNASGVRLHVSHTTPTSPKSVAFRNKGSSADILDRIEAGAHITIDVGISALDVFEARLEATGFDYNIHLLGYWDDTNVVFLSEEVDAGTVAGAWTGRSISAETGADPALAALITFHQASSSDRAMGVRQTGSTDARIQDAQAYGLVGSTAVGLNGSKSFDYYQSSNFANVYITGYIKTGVTMNTNATDITPGTTGSWQPLSVGSVDGAFIEVVGATTEFLSFGVRPKDNADYDTFYGEMSKYHALASVSSDGGVDGKIESSDVSLFLLGTIDGSGVGGTITGDASITTEDATLSATGSQIASASADLSVTTDDATLVATGSSGVYAMGYMVTDDATLVATGTVFDQTPVTADLSITTDDATLVSTGVGAISTVAELSVTTDAATLSSTAESLFPGRVGDLSVTTEDATLVAGDVVDEPTIKRGAAGFHGGSTLVYDSPFVAEVEAEREERFAQPDIEKRKLPLKIKKTTPAERKAPTKKQKAPVKFSVPKLLNQSKPKYKNSGKPYVDYAGDDQKAMRALGLIK